MASLFKNLFKQHGAKNLVTLFHKPGNQASTRATTIAKQMVATSAVTATEDQASSHDAQNGAEKVEFELEVTEAPPTSDQLKTIMEYLGAGSAGKVVQGASNEKEALQLLEKSGEAFQRPVLVSWHQGKAVAGANESEILSLLRSVPKA